jgi:hypothetical protein
MLTIEDAVYVKDTASPTNTASPIASYILADITGHSQDGYTAVVAFQTETSRQPKQAVHVPNSMILDVLPTDDPSLCAVLIDAKWTGRQRYTAGTWKQAASNSPAFRAQIRDLVSNSRRIWRYRRCLASLRWPDDCPVTAEGIPLHIWPIVKAQQEKNAA